MKPMAFRFPRFVVSRLQRRAPVGLVVGVALLLPACGGPPRDALQQYVTRDAWDATCAESAMIEKWVVKDGHWKTEGDRWVMLVDATFKMANECTSKLPSSTKTYKQFETVTFAGAVEMAKCKDPQGNSGWAVPGREASRCWSGPTLLKG
jgi:hypothetical protein